MLHITYPIVSKLDSHLNETVRADLAFFDEPLAVSCMYE